MYNSKSTPMSKHQPHSSPMYYSPTQSAMEKLLPRPVPVARPSLKGKYYSPTTTIQRVESSSTLGGSQNYSPITAHSPSGRQHLSIDTGDGPFADSPPTLPPKEREQKPAFPRPMAVGQPLRSSSSRDFTSNPGYTQQYESPRQAHIRPLRTSSSQEVRNCNGASPRSMSSREVMASSPRSVSSREAMKRSPRSVPSREGMKCSPKGGAREPASPREAPRISPKASMPEMSKPFPRKMSVVSQPSTIAASINAGTRVRQQEMTQPRRVETMSTTNISADIKDIPRAPKKPNSCLRDCFDCCCCVFGTGACWSDH